MGRLAGGTGAVGTAPKWLVHRPPHPMGGWVGKGLSPSDERAACDSGGENSSSNRFSVSEKALSSCSCELASHGHPHASKSPPAPRARPVRSLLHLRRWRWVERRRCAETTELAGLRKHGAHRSGVLIMLSTVGHKPVVPAARPAGLASNPAHTPSECCSTMCVPPPPHGHTGGPQGSCPLLLKHVGNEH